MDKTVVRNDVCVSTSLLAEEAWVDEKRRNEPQMGSHYVAVNIHGEEN